jgi:hypothetical protein
MFGGDDISDLAFLVAPGLSSVSANDGQALAVVRPNFDLIPFRAAENAGIADLHDIEAIVALPNIQHSFRRRSWELLQHARDQKLVKRAKQDVREAIEKKEQLERTMIPILALFPSVRKLLGGFSLVAASKRDPDHLHLRCQLMIRMSLLPPSSKQSTSVSIACSRIATAIHAIQSDVTDKVLIPHAHEEAIHFRVVVVCHQWDETLQKMRSAWRFPNRKSAATQVRIQTMVQHGRTDLHMFDANGMAVVQVVPWFCKSLFLWRQTANFIIEGLLRQGPFRFDDIARMVAISSASDVVVLSFSRDGASPNTVALEWIWDVLVRTSPVNILPHSHLCSLHRAAIARSRVQGFAAIAAALQSFTRFIRISKNMEGLVSSVHHVVSQALVVVRRPRPDVFGERARKLSDLMFKSGSDDYLYKQLPDGSRVKTALHEDIDQLLRVTDLWLADEGGTHRITHWCYVRAGSFEHTKLGMQVGAPCCASAEESLDKTLAPIVCWLTSKSWHQMALNRWTHVPSTMRRALMLCLGPTPVLLKALDHLRHNWEIDYSLETGLARALAIDSDDFAGQNKLRLLRLCKALCKPSVPLDIGMGMMSTAAIDNIMYALFGFKRCRVSILDLMKPQTSVITKAQVSICDLLHSWLPSETNSWFPIALLGANFADSATRVKARAQALQMSCGIFDAFEMRMQFPPYSLVVLCSEESPDVIDGVISQFEAIPDGCLSLFCQRFKQLCNSSIALKIKGPTIIQAWATSSFVAIDLSERSHASMRVDLSTSGPGRSPTVSSNRCFCKSVHAAHVAVGGDNITASSVVQSTNVNTADQTVVRRTVGGNPWMHFYNSRMQSFKAMHAPNRRITAPEREKFDVLAMEAWAVADAEEKALWADCHVAANLGRKAGALVARDDPSSSIDNDRFRGLWGLGESKQDMIPAACLEQHAGGCSDRKRNALVWQDDGLNIREAPDRVSDIHQKRDIDGCFGQKKHMQEPHPHSSGGDIIEPLHQTAELLC